MKTKILIHSITFFVLAIFCISCDKTQVFDEYHTFKDGWNKKQSVNFEFENQLTQKANNLFINIRANDDYEYSNLFLIVKLEHPSGKIKVDTLEYQMANPDGSMLGEGFSDIKESKLWYEENAKFTEKGKYKLSISQAVRQTGKVKGVEKLKGITDIGFRIESLEQK
ncbi:gliding motility lipoprotein GldH [Flavobacterium sp.]|uniref:gliding motility lipoprotein GldH n=1 Tax=Flavobacterium sp. TaxID=239 RepID=UPI00286DAC67|nr:gliding motility lipoprotein GldH [Flavobacterium sp.]